MQIKKGLRYAHFAFLALSAVVILFYIIGNQAKESIFPAGSTQIEYNVIHECVDSNYSSTSFSTEKDGIHFKYKLNSIHKEAFATLYFHTKKLDTDFFDLNKYNRIHISLTTKKTKRIPLIITVDVPGVTKKNDPLSHVHLVQILECNPGDNYFIVPFKEMEIPNWWLRKHQLDKDFFQRVDFSRVTTIMLSSDHLVGRGIEDEYIIQSIQLANDNRAAWYSLVFCIVITVMVELIFRIKKRKKTEILISPSYSSTDPKTETDKIEAYIAVHYSNPELEVGDLQKGLGISSRKISTLLLEKFSMSFTDYVNQIRIAEVKRLLIESDAAISTIAYQVGFGNVSHFNRVFKQLTGKSPSQFREEKEVKKS